MTELPKKFPEYSIMYKTLSRQIETLRHQLKSTNQEEADGIKSKIEIYESEIIKIKEMFPRDYFERKD